MDLYLYPKKPKRTWKFWVLFWFISMILLVGWAGFLKVKNDGIFSLINFIRPMVNVMPTTQERRNELKTIFDIVPDLTKADREYTYLVLFQNNMELRPGGGFIGSFGILKTNGEKVTFIDTHDTNVVDSRIESGVEPPYPMGKFLNIKNWELRDSNWSADFPTNAKQADVFYKMEGGTENFDGVIAISTDVLESFLEITGPVTIDGYPGEYNSENAVVKLEYQVEKGYAEQGQEKGERKYIMKAMSKVLLDKAQAMGWSDKKKLLESIETHLNNKDILIYFKDDSLQDKMRFLGWTGEMKPSGSDYLMMVDANLGALKSDQYIKRSFDYVVDFSGEKPKVNLKITYEHTARARDWMTSNYNSYLRIFVPEGSWLSNATNVGEQSYGSELGKKFFGFLVNVPIGQSKTIELSYDLPANISEENYELLIQKQSGVGTVPGNVTLIFKDGSKKKFALELSRDSKVK